MKLEATLKAGVKRELKRQLPDFVLLSYATAGAPDLSIVGNGMQTNWEFKHATPGFVSHGIQVLFAMRLARQGHCRYVIWQTHHHDRTLIVHPDAVYNGTWNVRHEAENTGYGHRWLVEQVRNAHGL